MMSLRPFLVLLGLSLLAGCLSSEKQVESALRENPEILFRVIEENPEKFMNAVNTAVRKAQSQQAEAREKSAEERTQAELRSPRKPNFTADRILRGQPDARIVVVEYGDFQCPACAVGYQQFKPFKEKHQQDLAFVFKHMPLDFHPLAMPASLAFEIIRRDSKEKAWQFYEEAYRQPGRIESQKDLEQIVKNLGYDWKSLMKSKHVEAAKKTIAEDQAEFRAFGYTGTPVFILNGVSLSGAQPTEIFERVRAATSP